ncbi:hypothetical protein C2E21_4532 [Chlorella sorokiniana]|uniref:Uncharacterized protein n=1 Tax=Chlorella sorokiniana TaxID=3076 RepID=A0A2P6TS05_CHLSO|nr:hypothetical protein C2E21_4532 [Chlorella sorokiniana]|eukprot:PRW56836.1 hypothetical protein C2E21_4532 [Chlorella sorokiniana]
MATAGEECLTASFSSKEQHLIDQLRAKYSAGPSPPAAAQAQAPAQPSAAAPAAAAQPGSCRLCSTCQGTGTVAEAYNHRTLERCCPECRGQGTTSSSACSGSGSTHSSSTRSGSGSTHSSGGGGKSACARLAGWEAELEALKQSLAGVTDSRELQLKSALILELERAAAALRKAIPAAKQEERVAPPTQGLADLNLGSSAGEEAQGRSDSAVVSAGEEGHAECCAAAAATHTANDTAEAGAAAAASES